LRFPVEVKISSAVGGAMKLRFAPALLAVIAFACGGPVTIDDNPGTPDGGPGPTGTNRPAVVLVAPEDRHEFEFENEDDDHHGDDRFELQVELRNAELAEIGQCRGRGNCGHLVLLIDGNACGNPNSSSSSGRFEGRFGRCVKVSGQHQIVVQLVDDAGNVLAATAPITVNVKLKGRGGNNAGPGGNDHHDDDDDDHHGGDDHGDHDGGDDHGGGGGGGGDDGMGHH
jgi:hypothetical protein